MRKLFITMALLFALTAQAQAYELVITIPNELTTEYIDAFCSKFNYQEYIGEDEDGNPIPNPQGKAAFSKERIRMFLRAVYKQYQVDNIDRQAVVDAANEDTEGITVE